MPGVYQPYAAQIASTTAAMHQLQQNLDTLPQAYTRIQVERFNMGDRDGANWVTVYRLGDASLWMSDDGTYDVIIAGVQHDACAVSAISVAAQLLNSALMQHVLTHTKPPAA